MNPVSDANSMQFVFRCSLKQKLLVSRVKQYMQVTGLIIWFLCWNHQLFKITFFVSFDSYSYLKKQKTNIEILIMRWNKLIDFTLYVLDYDNMRLYKFCQ